MKEYEEKIRKSALSFDDIKHCNNLKGLSDFINKYVIVDDKIILIHINVRPLKGGLKQYEAIGEDFKRLCNKLNILEKEVF